MKVNILAVVMLLIFTVVSCKKKFVKEPGYEPKGCELCIDGEYEDIDNYGSNVKQYIVKTIKIDESCGFIVGGYVKYVKNGKTIALVDYYGKGKCDGWAVKTLCYNGDCKDNMATFCKFKQNCELPD